MSAKKSPPQPLLQHARPRPGEGYSLDVTLTATQGDKGLVNINLAELPVPDRKFSCDAVGIKDNPNLVQLLFAQSLPVGAGYLSMLVINMSLEAVQQFVHSVTDDFYAEYSRNSTSYPPGSLTDFLSNANQTVILPGSMVIAGYTGTDACMDFYHASPFSVQQVATIKKLSVEPVVRVHLPSPLMFAMLSALKRVSENLPAITGLK